MTRLMVLIIAMLLMDALLGLPGAAAESDQKADVIPAEDYALYDQVVTSKFLTSATQLVVIERMTRFRLSPDQEGPTTIESLSRAGVFRWRAASGSDPGIHLRSTGNQAGSKDDFTLVSAIGLPRGTSSKSRRSLAGARVAVSGTTSQRRPQRSGAVGAGSSGLLSRSTKPSQRSCAALCRSPTSRRHRSRIPRVVSPSRTKLDVV